MVSCEPTMKYDLQKERKNGEKGGHVIDQECQWSRLLKLVAAVISTACSLVLWHLRHYIKEAFADCSFTRY